MDELLDRFAKAWTGPFQLDAWDLLLGTLCALCCGFVICETYRRTHRGSDFSRPFLQVLLIITLLVSFVTLVVGDDLARAFTLVGALSVVRFRTAVKESRDLAFIFWAVGAGMGAGCRFVGLTIGFTVLLAAVVAFVTWRNYGVRDHAIRVLRVRLDSKSDYDSLFTECFKAYLSDSERLSVGLVRQGLLYEIVYLVRLQDSAKEREFLESVREMVGDNPVTLSHRDEKTAF